MRIHRWQVSQSLYLIRMTDKKSISLNKKFEKIESRTFDEDDIKLMLIEIRDYLKKETFLREICDFIAHPSRNKGICHNRINSRYAKQKFVKEGMEQLTRDGTFEKNKDKSWSFFSEKILGYIQTEQIDKTLFEIIILEGLDEISDTLYLKHYDLNKNQVRNLILRSYTKEKGYYNLSSPISDSEFRLIDDLLKFIRGTITGKSAFEQDDIEVDLIKAISTLTSRESINLDATKIKEAIDEIIVCILAILHTTQFLLFDDTTAFSYLSVHPLSNGRKNTDKFSLCLMANAGNFSFPVVMTKIDAINYIETASASLAEWNLKSIPWVFAKRDNENKLKLLEKLV